MLRREKIGQKCWNQHSLPASGLWSASACLLYSLRQSILDILTHWNNNPFSYPRLKVSLGITHVSHTLHVCKNLISNEIICIKLGITFLPSALRTWVISPTEKRFCFLFSSKVQSWYIWKQSSIWKIHGLYCMSSFCLWKVHDTKAAK